jgi:hypothetical protein
MYVVTARLRGVTVAEHLGELRRMVLDEALPGDLLEHVYVEPAPGGAAVAMFMLARSVADAEGAAARLCQRLLNSSLTGSVLDHCRVARLTSPAEGPRLENGGGVTGSGQYRIGQVSNGDKPGRAEQNACDGL